MFSHSAARVQLAAALAAARHGGPTRGCAKLVQGTNSMTRANKVLPMNTCTPRDGQAWAGTPILANKVQIGNKRNRPTALANARSQAQRGSFNQTVVTSHAVEQTAVRRLYCHQAKAFSQMPKLTPTLADSDWRGQRMASTVSKFASLQLDLQEEKA